MTFALNRVSESIKDEHTHAAEVLHSQLGDPMSRYIEEAALGEQFRSLGQNIVSLCLDIWDVNFAQLFFYAFV